MASGTKSGIFNMPKDNPHDWYTVETQKNIVFNDAGAFWQARTSQGKSGSINIDPALLQTYNSSALVAPKASAFLQAVGAAIKAATKIDVDTLLSNDARFAADADLSIFGSP